jgi:hypothetical protein
LVGAEADGEVFDKCGKSSGGYFVIGKNAAEIKEKMRIFAGFI